MKAMTPAQKLREVLAGPGLEVMPGCFDALSAKLVADAGFKVTFMSGFAVSAARLGVLATLSKFSDFADLVLQTTTLILILRFQEMVTPRGGM